MKKNHLIIIAMLLVVAMLAACSPKSAPLQPVPAIDGATGNVSTVIPTITVSGVGELTLKPDMATVELGIQILNGATAQKATDDAAKAMEGIKQALVSLGIKEEDLRTSQFSMYETYDYDGKGNIVGKPKYNVTNTLSVDIYDIDNVGKYIDAAIEAGATNSYGMVFGMKDAKARENEVLELAMANARSRAEALAAAAGRKLGSVLLLNDGTQISEQVFNNEKSSPAAPMAAAMDAGGRNYATTVEPGTTKLTATISARFTLE